jgi:hypothetical protein
LRRGKTFARSRGRASCHTLKDAGATGTVGPNSTKRSRRNDLVVERVSERREAPMPSFAASSPARRSRRSPSTSPRSPQVARSDTPRSGLRLL